MTDADYMREELGMPECHLLSETRPVARKEHACNYCDRGIAVGTRYRRCFMLIDGEPWTEKTCRECWLDQP